MTKFSYSKRINMPFVLARIFKLGLPFLFLLVSCGPILYPNKAVYKKALKQEPYDVVIVPGYPHSEKGWGLVVQMRVLWANYLYQNKIAKHVIFSGSAVYTPYVESKAMRLYGVALGIPDSVIYTEERAEHSVENVYYSYCIARDLGFKKIGLATNAPQINQIRSFVKKYEIAIEYLPIVIDTLRELDDTEPIIEPYKIPDFVSLPEKQSLFKRLKGTFGSYVIWREEDLKKKRFVKKMKKQNRLIPKEE